MNRMIVLLLPNKIYPLVLNYQDCRKVIYVFSVTEKFLSPLMVTQKNEYSSSKEPSLYSLTTERVIQCTAKTRILLTIL